MKMRSSLPLLSCIIASLALGEGIPRQQPIIDMHLHAYPPDQQFSGMPANPVTGKPSSVRDGAAHMTATLEQMREHNVVKGLVGAGDVRSDVVLPWSKAAPDRIIASAGFSGAVDLPFPDLSALRKAYQERRYGAMGEIGAQYAGLCLADARYEAYLAMAEELDIPVGVHTGISFPGITYDPCCPNFRTSLGNPQLIEEVLVRHPRLRIYLMHGGWPYTQETIALMSVYPQVHADLAVINWIIPPGAFRQHLRSLINAGLSKRLMFGSDQMRWPEAVGMAIDGIESATFLTPEQKEDIFCNNAARFLRWEGKDNPCR